MKPREEDVMKQGKEQRGHDPQGRPRKPEDAAAAHPTKEESQDEEERDDAIEEASADSFPSSDPPSW